MCGIRVALIEPGMLRSDFYRNQVRRSRTVDTDSPCYSYGLRVRDKSRMFERWAGDPVQVARTISNIHRFH